MADVTLHDSAVSFPSIAARANMPLKLQFSDRFVVEVPITRALVAARRASTSDPWEIQMSYVKATGRFIFDGPLLEFDAKDLNWKSMADLTIKQHYRTTAPMEWTLIAQTPFFGVADATQPCGRRDATLAEQKTVLGLKFDDGGNARINFTPQTGISFNNYGQATGMVAALISYVLSQTSATSASGSTQWYVEDLNPSDKSIDGYVRVTIPLVAIQGTDNITVANLSSSKIRVKVDAAAAGGYEAMNSTVDISPSGVYEVPSIHLDHLRKAQNAGVDARVQTLLLKDKGLNIEVDLSSASANTPGTVVKASMLDPDGVVSITYDQANSMNVLAAAAFAGLAGLASVGVATELRSILENSALAPLFQEVAVALGQTTAGVVTGYVSALVAAYSNGWIDDESLFNLQNHVSWLRSGTTILLAGGAIGAAGSVLSAMVRLGVDSSLVANAITTASGALAGGGIALGMASVMAKVVKHRYLGA